MKFVLSMIVLFAVTHAIAQDQPPVRKYYCPPCNCHNDGIQFDKPGTCPDPGCGMELLPVDGPFVESKLKFFVQFLRSPSLIRVYDMLIFPAIIQALILGLILIFRGSANRYPPMFLATLLGALAFQNIKFYYVLMVLVNYISSTGGNPEYNIELLSFPLSGVLFIGPALYFYVKSLTHGDFRFTTKDLLHFVPGVMFIIANSIVFFNLVSPDHSKLVKLLTSFASAENVLAISLSFFYIVAAIREMQKHELWIYQHFSTTTRKSLRWLRSLIIILSVVWVVWLFAVVINLFTGDFILTYLSAYPFQVITSIIIFWVGYAGFLQSEIFSLEISLERNVEHLRSTAKKETETNQEIKSRILRAMEQDKLFLIPDLTLASLGQQLNLSPKGISQTLNSDLNKNFHDFINSYRVEEVKKRLLNPAYQHLTILAIALDSGFNSKSSFNRIFMQTEGISPKIFREKTLIEKD
jgi:AraC-like DNA-binding protein